MGGTSSSDLSSHRVFLSRHVSRETSSPPSRLLSSAPTTPWEQMLKPKSEQGSSRAASRGGAGEGRGERRSQSSNGPRHHPAALSSREGPRGQEPGAGGRASSRGPPSALLAGQSTLLADFGVDVHLPAHLSEWDGISKSFGGEPLVSRE